MSASLIGYLNKRDPAIVQALAREHPEAGDLFSPHVVLGGPAAVDFSHQVVLGGPAGVELAPMPAMAPDIRKAKIALVAAGLLRLGPELQGIESALRHRLQVIRRFKLAGGIIAVIGGAVGALMVLVGKQMALPKEAETLGVSVVSMIGGLCTVLAGYWETSPSGQKVNAADELSRISEQKVELERISAQLRNDAAYPLADAEIDAMVKKLDEQAIDAVRLSDKV